MGAFICSPKASRRKRLIINCPAGEDSCNHNARHDAVEELKKAGVNSVVGVYIKIPDSYPDDSPELMRQKAILNSNPPTPDGLAFLFTIVEDERD